MGSARGTHTINFRACILDVKPMQDGTTSVLLTVWHVGPSAKDLLPGAHIDLRIRDFVALYGEPLADDPTRARGFTLNYRAEQAADGSLTKLRLEPKGADDKLILSDGPFADPSNVISITQ